MRDKDQHREYTNKEIKDVFDESKLLSKKQHKRIESVNLNSFSDKNLLSHRKYAQSEIEKFIPGFEALKRHDKCKIDYSEFNKSLKKSMSQAELNSMVDRLHKYYQIYNDRKKAKKNQSEDELMSSLSFKPKISQNSKSIINNLSRKHVNDELRSKYMPIYEEERLKEIENSKKMKIERIKQELQLKEELRKQEEDEILEIVAQKTDPSKYKREEYLEKIELELKAYQMRKREEQLK